MRDILERKLSSIFNNIEGDCFRLELSIECPLDSGLKATGVLFGGEGETYPNLGSVKDFFLYVSEYRKENPEHSFNRIKIVASSSKEFDVMFSFDEDLHRRTMENIQ